MCSRLAERSSGQTRTKTTPIEGVGRSQVNQDARQESSRAELWPGGFLAFWLSLEGEGQEFWERESESGGEGHQRADLRIADLGVFEFARVCAVHVSVLGKVVLTPTTFFPEGS